jgi:hypothetical protein
VRNAAYFPFASWNCGLLEIGYPPSCADLAKRSGLYVLPKTVMQLADVDGSGIPRFFYKRYFGTFEVYSNPNGNFDPTTTCSDDSLYQVTVAGTPGTSATLGAAPTGTFPGLLQSVSLLGGEQQTLTYQSIRSLPGVGGTVPVAAWVVTGIQTTNGMPATSQLARTSSVSYAYQTPLYDARDKQFVGFRSVTETHAGDPGAPGLVRTTTFATTACGATSGTPCTGQVDYGWFRALRGLPLFVEDADTSGVGQATLIHRYHQHRLATGLDGRVVRRLPLREQVRYDWPGATKHKTAPTTVFSGLGTTPYEAYTSAYPFTVVIPSNHPTHQQSWTENDIGNQTVSIDFGEVGVDTPIRTEQTWELPKGDKTKWSYRVKTRQDGVHDHVGRDDFGHAARAVLRVRLHRAGQAADADRDAHGRARAARRIDWLRRGRAFRCLDQRNRVRRRLHLRQRDRHPVRRVRQRRHHAGPEQPLLRGGLRPRLRAAPADHADLPGRVRQHDGAAGPDVDDLRPRSRADHAEGRAGRRRRAAGDAHEVRVVRPHRRDRSAVRRRRRHGGHGDPVASRHVQRRRSDPHRVLDRHER